MIRHLNGSAVVVVSLMAAFYCQGADSPAEDKAKQDLERMQGTWVVQKMTADGLEAPQEVATKMSFKIKGDIVQLAMDGDVDEDGVTIKLDASLTPCTIDFTNKNKKVDRGIYKFAGDTLTFCTSPAESKKPRPAKFESTEENKAILVTMKKPAPKK